MSKALVPNPDKAQGLVDEFKSQGTGLVIGVVTAAVAVPFLGWVFGGVAGVAAVGVNSYRSWRRKRRG